MYKTRASSELTPTASLLASEGITLVNDVYSVNTLAAINSAMNPLFSARSGEARAYIRSDEMLEMGILDKVLSPAMRNLLLAIMPDPVFYHFHAYEIAGNSSQSHIFADQLGGWHRDPDSKYFPADPTHVSIFVYLSDVGEGDGAFEFSPQQPSEPLRPNSPAITMIGPTGMSFVWHRSFYHRASPNRGPRRRRLLKISIQRNAFHSTHLENEFFRGLRQKVTQGDLLTDLLLGRFQGKAAPSVQPNNPVFAHRLTAARIINVPEEILAEMREREKSDVGRPVAYD